MKGRILAVLALSVALIAPAAFAQQSGTQSEPAQPAAVSNQAGQAEVTGTIVTLTADRIDVSIDSVTAPPEVTAGSTIMVGKTTSFALSSATEMPQGLQVGNQVDLWFTNDNGSLRATRLALAVSADKSAGSDKSASTSQASNASSSGPSEQPSTSSASASEQPSSSVSGSTSSGEQSPSTAEPATANAAAKTAHRESLPKTGSPLPLIGLIGLLALASVFVLRFVVRA